MAKSAQRRTLNRAQAALIRGMSDQELADIAGPYQHDRLAGLTNADLNAVIDGDPYAAEKLQRALQGKS